MTAQVVVSLSGIGTDTVAAARRLAADLDRWRVPLSLLVAPGRGALRGVARDWVADRAAGADRVLLHGFDHTCGGWPWRRPEFAALPAHEAGLKLVAARLALARVGLSTNWFAAPAWLASPGARLALRRAGFRLSAELRAVHDLTADALVAGRVLRVAGDQRADPWWAHPVVRLAARQARRGGLVRLAVRAGDLARPDAHRAVLDAVEAALRHGARPVAYPELLAGAAPAQVWMPSPVATMRTEVSAGASVSSQW